MNGARPILYDAAKVASAASHGIDEFNSVRDGALAIPAGWKQATDATLITQGIGIRADRRARELLHGTVLRRCPKVRRSPPLSRSPTSPGFPPTTPQLTASI